MAVTIQVSPAQDPAYLAFLRSTGVQESELSGEAARRISVLNRGLNRRLPTYADREQRGLEATGADFENRGMFRSGARQVAQARVSTDVARDRLEDTTTTGDAVADTSMNLASDIARIRRANAEAELDARSRLGSTPPTGVR